MTSKSTPVVTIANRADNTRQSPTLSDISIVHFPPNNPTLAFLHTSGQVGSPPPNTNNPFPHTFREQASNAFANVAACLAVGGATSRDISKLTIYIVDINMEIMRDDLIEVITAFFNDGEGQVHKPPSSLIGVAGLADGKFLIEVEAEAVVSLV
ncbi:Endoribonuclease L-PSP/chorismate mutase-like protein [Aspergillus cavernicola]|uniref:Endoribonuclease L-PSP/chorismate mutase-like protein n=1 Tax=Aspergillus cavernicola TaxID=176166 RepID=A0ABR4II05_9EURO